MTLRRTAATLRAFSKPVLAGVLVLLLFVSALASASPSLHHWLHNDDHQTPSHYCLVTVLDHGGNEIVSSWIIITPAAADVPVSELPCESFFISHDAVLYPERGPPVLS